MGVLVGGRRRSPARARTPRGVVALALGLQGLGVVAAAVAWAVAGVPQPVVLLLALVVAMAVCANRDAVFPSEYAVTAESAVLACALFAFDGPARLAAPLLLTVLSGWLDAHHWAARSPIRMAFNSGKAATATLAAGLTAVAIDAATPDSAVAVGGALLGAALAYAVVDSAAMVLLGVARTRRSVRVVAPTTLRLDALTFPLAAYGAVAGLIAAEGSGVVAMLVLAPVVALPELMAAPWMRRSRGARLTIVCGLALSAVLVLVLEVTQTGHAGTALALIAVGAVVALEVVPAGRNGALPTLVLVAALGAVVADASTWGVALAVVGGSVVAGAGMRALVSSRAGVVVWCVLLLATALPLASVVEPAWAAVAAGALGLAAAALATTWWGTTPWQPGRLTRLAANRLPARRTLALLAATALAVATVAAGVALGVDDRPTDALLTVATTTTGLAVAMVAVGVRQWRFARRRRDTLITALWCGSVALLVSALVPVADAARVVVVVVVVAGVAAAGLPVARLADAASPRRRTPTPAPDRPDAAPDGVHDRDTHTAR